MSRLSRDWKRGRHAEPGPAAPIEVHVPGEADPGSASVGGVRVVAVSGEQIQQTVLNHLHRIALATGHTVQATIHDTRIGYVVPLEVAPDGSSGFRGEPVRTGPGETGVPVPVPSPVWPEAAGSGEAEWPGASEDPAPGAPAASDAVPPRWARHDEPTHLLSSAEEPVRDAVPTFRMRAVQDDAPPVDEAPPTFTLRTLHGPDRPQAPGPGTAAVPMGEFGPPPVMDTPPASGRGHESAPAPTPVTSPRPATTPYSPHATDDLDPAPKPTPPRGFDAVAEAVLGDEALTAPGDATAPALLAEPMGRINEAVKAGRTDDAAGLAEQTLAQASSALGPEHPEVLRLRELTAYIAYLAGDPVRALHLSLDLARVHHDSRDAEAAYGNVQSAFTAWRAVRDPQLGLDLGHGLIALWTELTAEEGPAADDIEQLEKARARMDRLAERARDKG